MRTTYGKNSMQHRIPRIEHHYYKMTADGTNFADLQGRPVTRLSQLVLDDGGNGSNGFRAFAANPFPAQYPVRDPVKQFFTPGGNNEVYVLPKGETGAENLRKFATVRGGGEGTGPWFSRNGKQLYLSIQDQKQPDGSDSRVLAIHVPKGRGHKHH